MKNIVLCFDGTGKQYEKTSTNVVKIYQCLDLEPSADLEQVAFYDPGVGTGNPRTAVTKLGVKVSQGLGLAFGTGIYRNIADAYRYLMEMYAPGDRVFIFGFSRGAYTARALCGMLHMLGLLQPGTHNLIPYALDIYRQRIPKNEKERSEHFQLAAGFRKTYSRTCNPHFLGVWDTVKTVGLWDAMKIATHLQTALPYTASLPDAQFGRHAISIDERRSRFRPNLWDIRKDNNMQQVWFTGSHSDVGGGYEASGLSDAALLWMLKGAEHNGLRFVGDAFERFHPDACQPINESLTWKWWIMGWKKRSIRGPGNWDAQAKKWQAGPPSIHSTVQTRMEKTDYQIALPNDFRVVGDAWDEYSE